MSDDRRSSVPPDPEDDRHGGTKRLVGRLLKKGFETGFDAISKSEDTVRGVIEGMKLPREMASAVFDQIDETKNGLYRAVAKETRDFLQSTNFVEDARRILTGLAFEVKMEVRFKSTEDADGTVKTRPDVTADVAVKDKSGRRKRLEPTE